MQRLREQVSDLSLAGRAAYVESLARNVIRGALGTQQLRPHLRPVAVGDDQVIAVANQADDRCRRAARIRQLLDNRALLPRADQGVATDGDEHGLHGSVRQ